MFLHPAVDKIDEIVYNFNTAYLELLALIVVDERKTTEGIS